MPPLPFPGPPYRLWALTRGRWHAVDCPTHADTTDARRRAYAEGAERVVVTWPGQPQYEGGPDCGRIPPCDPTA